MSDLLNRQDVINEITELRERILNMTTFKQWIPCSERLPKESGRYLTTNSGWGDWITDWNIWTGDHWYYADRNPVAWMPMPRPYGEE